jgi:hypothetical protein
VDEAEIERRARELGFERAFALCKSDVIAAGRRAELQRAQLDAPAGPDGEPWPPMRCDAER